MSCAAESYPRYVIDPMAPFPKRWRDQLGDLRVMGGPIEGYLMVRRNGAAPFIISVKQMLNAERHPVHGPFEYVGPVAVRRRPAVQP